MNTLLVIFCILEAIAVILDFIGKRKEAFHG